MATKQKRPAKKINRKQAAEIQAAALRALHERGHYTPSERCHINRCECGGFLFRGDILCYDCVKDVAKN